MQTLRHAALFAPSFVLLAVACGSSSSGSSPDSGMTTGMDGSADTSSTHSDAGDGSASCANRPSSGTIPADVEAVLQNKCQTCHSDPPTDHAPFPLVTYADTSATDMLADHMGETIWKVMGEVIQTDGSPHMPFGNAPALTSDEFSTLNGWLQSCALPGSGGGDGGGDAGAEGNILIADQYNNRVIEVTSAGAIVFTFGDGSSVPGPKSVVAPNDAERLPNAQTLISGSGTPSGEPDCPKDAGKAGCPDNRVLIVDDKTGAIVWQYGADGGVSGSGPDKLSVPVASTYVATSSGAHVLITDQGNNRIIEVVQSSKDIFWTYPPTGATGTQMLNAPNSAERLASGNTLITDEGGNRVIEVTNAGAIVWQYPPKVSMSLLSGPAFASRLPNGNTLITDTGNGRILEVDNSSPPVVVATIPTNVSAGTTRAVRLANGNTLISNSASNQVLELDSTSQHSVVFTYGMKDVGGGGTNQLNGPYDAKVVNDFTGLTPPM